MTLVNYIPHHSLTKKKVNIITCSWARMVFVDTGFHTRCQLHKSFSQTIILIPNVNYKLVGGKSYCLKLTSIHFLTCGRAGSEWLLISFENLLFDACNHWWCMCFCKQSTTLYHEIENERWWMNNLIYTTTVNNHTQSHKHQF